MTDVNLARFSVVSVAVGCLALGCLPRSTESQRQGTQREANPPSWAPRSTEPEASPVDTTVSVASRDVTPASSARGAPVAEPGSADTDPSNDFVVAPPDAVPDCEARLTQVGVRYEAARLPVQKGARGTLVCGAEQVVLYRGSASGIRYNAPALLTCTMALGLARFERVIEDEAEAHLHAHVKRIEHAGTYNCRKMARFSNMVSEHSYANAIDIRSITLDDGRDITVLRDFGKTDSEPAGEPSRFLRSIARRAYDERVFSVVLTPFFDALHRDHLHLDMARYRVDGTR